MTVLIYGATGQVGRLLTRELARRGLPCVLAGRDASRLEQLAMEHDTMTVRSVPIDDPSALRTAMDGSQAVVSCLSAGSLSESLIHAAIETRAHYVDLVGQQQFIRRVFEFWGVKAERRGVALVPACGFDYALGDCAARIAAMGHEPLAQLTIAYALDGPIVGWNSLQGAVQQSRTREVVYRDGRWRPAPLEVSRESFMFPGMGRRWVTRYGSGEIITVPRHTNVRTVRSMITVTALAPHPSLARFVPYLRPAAPLLLRTPLRSALRRLAAARNAPKAGDGRHAVNFMIVATAVGNRGATGGVVVRGQDFPELTAATLAAATERIVSPDFDRVGALGPAAAFSPVDFLRALKTYGVHWERV